MRKDNSILFGIMSLSPLLMFLLFYVSMSLALDDFYATPIVVAFLVACLYSTLILRGMSVNERFETLARGASRPGLMTMVWIFVLAGSFASVTKEMGAVDSTVNLTLAFLPSDMLLCGLFVASCFVSFSVGTSVGTIAALTPIACGVADKTEMTLPLLVAIVVGGAYFGDNLSFISDTTIMATRTQGCRMGDKFRYNIRIVFPAAFACFVLYYLLGLDGQMDVEAGDFDFILTLPYLLVIVGALIGMNVLLLLVLGTTFAGIVGLTSGVLTLSSLADAMNSGILGMSELIIVTLLAAGMMEAIRVMGGIAFLSERISQLVRGKRGAELCIAFLVMLTDFCTANNTIAILSVGDLAKEISCRYGIDPRRSASLLDTFSCFAQGIIPYGAQLLIAAGLACINPMKIIPFLYYPFFLGGVALLYIIFSNYEKNTLSAVVDSNN